MENRSSVAENKEEMQKVAEGSQDSTVRKIITHAYVAFTRYHHTERKIVDIKDIKSFQVQFDPASEYYIRDTSSTETEIGCDDSDDDNDYFPGQIVKVGTEVSLRSWLEKSTTRITVPPVKEFVDYPPKKVVLAQKRETTEKPKHSPSKIAKNVKDEAKKRLKQKSDAKKASIESNMQTVLEQTVKKQNERKENSVASVKKSEKPSTSSEKSINDSLLKNENVLLRAENKSLREQLALVKDSIEAHKLNARNLQEHNLELRQNISDLRSRQFKQMSLELKQTAETDVPSCSDSKSEYSSAYYSEPSSSRHLNEYEQYLSNQVPLSSKKKVHDEDMADKSSDDGYDCDYAGNQDVGSLREFTTAIGVEKEASQMPCNEDVKCETTSKKNLKANKIVSDDEKRDYEDWLVNKYPRQNWSGKEPEPKLLSRNDNNEVYLGFKRYVSLQSWAQIRSSKTQRKFIGNVTIGLLGENAYLYNKTGFKGNFRKKSSKGIIKKEFPAEVVAVVRDMLWRYLMRNNGQKDEVVAAMLKMTDYITIMSDAARDRDPDRRRKRAEAQKKRLDKKTGEEKDDIEKLGSDSSDSE